jgi:hypothetical protein
MPKDIHILELEQEYEETDEQEVSSITSKRCIHACEVKQLIEDRNRIATQKCWEDSMIYFNSMLSQYPKRRA